MEPQAAPADGPPPPTEASPRPAESVAEAPPRPVAAAPEGARPERPEGGGERRPERGGGRRRFGRRKVCSFCVEKATSIDYKDPAKLRRYLSDRARIDPRRKTGTCTKHQRWLGVALKRARHLALLPYTQGHMRLTGVFASRR